MSPQELWGRAAMSWPLGAFSWFGAQFSPVTCSCGSQTRSSPLGFCQQPPSLGSPQSCPRCSPADRSSLAPHTLQGEA